MKNSNVTGSTMFEDKSASADLFASGKIPSMKKDDSIISLVDYIPLYEQEGTTSLIKSADLMRSGEILMRFEESVPRMDSMPPSVFTQAPENLNQLLGSIQMPNLFSSNTNSLMKDYSFGSKTEAVTQIS